MFILTASLACLLRPVLLLSVGGGVPQRPANVTISSLSQKSKRLPLLQSLELTVDVSVSPSLPATSTLDFRVF